MTSGRWDAVVLAGGASRRMGGVDKTALTVGGTSLLDRAVSAVAAAECIVVVGAPRRTTLPVTWCREEPPLGGPAAALAAALPHVRSEILALVAGDQPFVDADAVARVVAAVQAPRSSGDGAVAVVDGQPQWLCSAWRASAVAAAALRPGSSLRSTIGALRWEGVPVDAAVAVDCDTPDDLRRARELR